jgi:hypothetical protein
MKNSKKDNIETRTPYEPPRLLNLGGSVAYAQGACVQGGSPSIAQCNTGSTATGASCKAGTIAGATCDAGGAASGGSCKLGNTATYSCKTGDTPMIF